MVVEKYEGANITICIDEEKCTGDGECVDTCPVNIFEIVDGKARATNIDECT